MERPKQHLIEECDADVIDYIAALEQRLEQLQRDNDDLRREVAGWRGA